MSRLHTAAAALLVAGIVLVPLGFWAYARAASVDRHQQVAHATSLLRVAGPPSGARNLGVHVYERRAWDGEGLVPVSGYTLETAYRLRRPLAPAQLVEHYRGRLPGWRFDGRTPVGVRFTREGDTIELDIAEYRDASARLRSYGVFVSQ